MLGRLACYLGFHRVITTRKPAPRGSTSTPTVAYACYRPGCTFGGVWTPTFAATNGPQVLTARATVKETAK